VISFVTIVATVVSFFYGWVLRRLSAGHVILVGLLCATGALIALGLGETTPSAVSGAALFGTFVGLVVPYIYQMASERSDVYTRGRAVGFTVACSYLGGFLNPLIVAPIIRAVGMHGTFLCIAGLVALLLIVRIASSRVRAIPVSRVG
jgi:MFS family permease